MIPLWMLAYDQPQLWIDHLSWFLNALYPGVHVILGCIATASMLRQGMHPVDKQNAFELRGIY